jgi:hypothetical protein
MTVLKEITGELVQRTALQLGWTSNEKTKFPN